MRYSIVASLALVGLTVALPTPGWRNHRRPRPTCSWEPEPVESDAPINSAAPVEPEAPINSATPVESDVDTPSEPTLPVVTPTPSPIASDDKETDNDGASSDATPGLWQPTTSTTWQIILNKIIDASGPLTPDVDVYDVDMYNTPAETIAQLHAKGKKVICYFSAGTAENYRGDYKDFTSSDLGAAMADWPDEQWVDVTSANVMNIMKKRIDEAAAKGCDAIDPDNMDGFAQTASTGVTFTQSDSLSYIRNLASYAATLGMSTGLKNSADLVPESVSFLQFVVNEECHEWNECAMWQPFIAAGKPVFNIEYPLEKAAQVTPSTVQRVCGGNAGDGGFSTLLKTMDLDGWVVDCAGVEEVTATV